MHREKTRKQAVLECEPESAEFREAPPLACTRLLTPKELYVNPQGRGDSVREIRK